LTEWVNGMKRLRLDAREKAAGSKSLAKKNQRRRGQHFVAECKKGSGSGKPVSRTKKGRVGLSLASLPHKRKESEENT